MIGEISTELITHVLVSDSDRQSHRHTGAVILIMLAFHTLARPRERFGDIRGLRNILPFQ